MNGGYHQRAHAWCTEHCAKLADLRNVNQLTRETQREKGKGTRVTVYGKLMELVEEGIVECGDGHSYRLAE